MVQHREQPSTLHTPPEAQHEAEHQDQEIIDGLS